MASMQEEGSSQEEKLILQLASSGTSEHAAESI